MSGLRYNGPEDIDDVRKAVDLFAEAYLDVVREIVSELTPKLQELNRLLHEDDEPIE